MLDAVATAIERDRKRRDGEDSVAGLRKHFETLTTREREVMALVTAGLVVVYLMGAAVACGGVALSRRVPVRVTAR